MTKRIRVSRGITATLSILLVFSLLMTKLLISWSGQVNIALNVTVPVAEMASDSLLYPSAYEMSDAGLIQMLSDSDIHDEQTMVEGAVLLKNENATLPLAQTETRITLFGRATADPVYRGNSGGPSINPERLVNLYDALSNAGLVINDTLYNAYAQSETTRIKGDPDWSIGEEPQSFYTQEIMESYSNDYNDAAIIMLSRDGGEGKDLPTSDREGISFLALHPEEKALLEMVHNSGKFNKTIVLINSAYAMELDWITEEAYGIDAAIWIGTPGLIGFTGVADLLVGKADPSGRLVDTFATNSLSSPAVQNAGDFTFANDKNHYIVEAENIYVGYKYYETRYQDQVLNIHNATGTAGDFVGEEGWNYADEMVYTFGYGMSYANFEEKLENIVWDQENHIVTASVKVTNLGAAENSSYTGKSKDVVELYAQLPYESGQAEKSSIQLIGFAKTDALAPGESQTVEISVDDYIFATYDENAVNGADANAKGCYIFDAGNYYFAIGNDAHDALNNVMAAKYGADVSELLFDTSGNVVTGDVSKVVSVSLAELDNVTYATSVDTGEIVSNQYEGLDINDYAEGTVTYLTREDWNTFPVPYVDLMATEEMIKEMNKTDDDYMASDEAVNYDSFTMGATNNLMLRDMADVEYEDEETWNKFLDQLSLSELCSIVGENFGQHAIETIGKPENYNSDGPAGPQNNFQYGEKTVTTVHVSEVIAAATWNTDIVAERGFFIAQDCLFDGTTQLWSPGANLHRTPFSGRNFEYYSEDSIMSYLMSAAQTKAMQENGVNAAIKHFCANDQETNRTGLATFMTEQGFRQGALKGFEGAFREGGALGTMLSCGRIGCKLLYADDITLTQVLRKEWGFKGVTITDSAKGMGAIPTVLSLVAGSNTFNADAGRATEIQKIIVATKDGYLLEQLRSANKNFYYAMAHSNLMNYATTSGDVVNFTPWWQTALHAISIIIGIMLVMSTVFLIKSIVSNIGGRKNAE